MDDFGNPNRRGRFAQGLADRAGQGLGRQAAQAARSYWTVQPRGGGHAVAGTPALGGAAEVRGPATVTWVGADGLKHYGTPASRDAWIAAEQQKAAQTTAVSPNSPAPAPKPPAPPPPAPAPAPAPTQPQSQFPGDPGKTGDMAFAQPAPAPAPDPGKTGDSFFTTPAPTGAATRTQIPVGGAEPDFRPQVAPRAETAFTAPPDVNGFLASRRRGGL